jgi:SAM-dependent methyltransferase
MQIVLNRDSHRGRTRILTLACVCLALAAGGLGLRHYLLDQADLSDYDPSPLPRPKIHAPFIKSPDKIVDKMLESADLTKNDLVYDLGCGDGRIVITAAARHGCRGVGFDKDPERVEEARENCKAQGVEELVTIEEADIFTLDLSEANVIVMYLLPWMVNELIPQFEAMEPGSRIVSHDFPLDDIEPEMEIEVKVYTDRFERHVVYKYVTPLKRKPASP